jgi:SAM-dependent methyltransferase
MVQLKACPNCSCTSISSKFVVQDRHYGIKGDFNFDVCNDCGLVFLNPMPNNEELSKFYPEESYYAYHMNFPTPKKDSFLKGIAKSILLLNSREEMKFDRPGKVLDIGCGNGWVLSQYKHKGWEVAGVEPSKVAAEIGNKAGLNIYNGTLLDAAFPSDKFDFVRSNHSFEHIFNPNEVLDEIYKILKPGGKLFIGIPNYAGMNSKLAKKYWYFLGAPVHTFNYSPRNIKQLLKRHNFEVTKIRHVAGSAGLLGSIQIYINRKNGKKSDEGRIANSKVLKLFGRYVGAIQNLFKSGDCIEVIAVKK